MSWWILVYFKMPEERVKANGHNGRRNHGGCSEQETEVSIQSGFSFFRLFLHVVACIASLALGLRLSGESMLISKQPQAFLGVLSSSIETYSRGNTPSLTYLRLRDSAEEPVKPSTDHVHVGRHDILVRPWPHPDPLELMKAYTLINKVQQAQLKIYEVDKLRNIIAITPTFPHALQILHLTGLIHTLSLVPSPLVWIVIELQGPTDEIARLLADSGAAYFHIGLNVSPGMHYGQQQLEARLRVEGLRFVKEKRMDGIVLFVDESNIHSLGLFEEAQRVKWLGALPIGFVANSEFRRRNKKSMHPSVRQIPVCTATGDSKIIWNAAKAGLGKNPQSLPEWAGFALNAALLWKDEGRPDWIVGWDEWISEHSSADIGHPLGLVKNLTYVEQLGTCGHNVLLWWMRVHVLADNTRPLKWMMHMPLRVVIPSRRTPWIHLPRDIPSALPSVDGRTTVAFMKEKLRRESADTGPQERSATDTQN